MKLKNFNYEKFVQFIRKAAVINLSVLSIAFLTGCSFFPKESEALAPPLSEPEKVTYSTVDVKKGTIEKKISTTAYLVSEQQTNLAFQFRGGYIKAIHVKTGSNVRTNHNQIKLNEDTSKNFDGKEDVTVKKGDVLAELDTGNLENEISMQNLVLRKTMLAFTKLRSELEIAGGGDKYALQQAEVDVEIAKLKLQNLQEEFEKSKLVAPISGVVDYIDESKVGEYISANKTFIRIVDPTQLLVESSEEGAAALKFGMKLDVELKGKSYKGEVVMAPYDVSAKDYEKARDFGKEQEYLKVVEKLQNTVRIKMDGMPKDAVIGDLARINANLSKKENVLLIPKNVVHTFEGRKFVKILKNDVVEEQDIETGLESSTEYEVVKGLNEGDKVVK